MRKKILAVTAFSSIFLCLILFVAAWGEEYSLEDGVGDVYEAPEPISGLADAEFLKERLTMLERIAARQREGYFALLGRLEEKNKYIDELKEKSVFLEKELFIAEREKAVLELMSIREGKALKMPPLAKKGEDLNRIIHLNLGYAYGSKGKLQDAIKEYRQALEYGPDDFDIHYNLGYLLAKKNLYKDAVEEYQKALRGDSSDREIYYNLAIIYSSGIKDKKMARYFYDKFLSFPSPGPAS